MFGGVVKSIAGIQAQVGGVCQGICAMVNEMQSEFLESRVSLTASIGNLSGPLSQISGFLNKIPGLDDKILDIIKDPSLAQAASEQFVDKQILNLINPLVNNLNSLKSQARLKAEVSPKFKKPLPANNDYGIRMRILASGDSDVTLIYYRKGATEKKQLKLAASHQPGPMIFVGGGKEGPMVIEANRAGRINTLEAHFQVLEDGQYTQNFRVSLDPDEDAQQNKKIREAYYAAIKYAKSLNNDQLRTDTIRRIKDAFETD